MIRIMERFARIFLVLSGYISLLLVTLGYWIEMAEELETAPGDIAAKAGKHILVVLKLLLFSR